MSRLASGGFAVDAVSVGDIPTGSVVWHEGRRWLVLASDMGPPPYGFYPPWELILQPLSGGPPHILRCTTARRFAVDPTELRELRFVCRQRGDLLLLEPASNVVVWLPEDRTQLGAGTLEPGSAVLVVYSGGRPLWVARHAEP